MCSAAVFEFADNDDSVELAADVDADVAAALHSAVNSSVVVSPIA